MNYATAIPQAPTKPSFQNLDEMLKYLDELRESCFINMAGATPYIMDEFAISRPEARGVLIYWQETFSERHPE
jgi:hypothetical protein